MVSSSSWKDFTLKPLSRSLCSGIKSKILQLLPYIFSLAWYINQHDPLRDSSICSSVIPTLLKRWPNGKSFVVLQRKIPSKGSVDPAPPHPKCQIQEGSLNLGWL